jgi:hypothetical protein
MATIEIMTSGVVLGADVSAVISMGHKKLLGGGGGGHVVPSLEERTIFPTRNVPPLLSFLWSKQVA